MYKIDNLKCKISFRDAVQILHWHYIYLFYTDIIVLTDAKSSIAVQSAFCQ